MPITVYKGLELGPDGKLRSILRYFFSNGYRGGHRDLINKLTCVYAPGKWRRFGSPRFVYEHAGELEDEFNAVHSVHRATVQIWKCYTRAIRKVDVPRLIMTRPRIGHLVGYTGGSYRVVVMDLKLVECVVKVRI